MCGSGAWGCWSGFAERHHRALVRGGEAAPLLRHSRTSPIARRSSLVASSPASRVWRRCWLHLRHSADGGEADCIDPGRDDEVGAQGVIGAEFADDADDLFELAGEIELLIGQEVAQRAG